jgi:putative endonuclease
MNQFFVYILTNKYHTVLYVGFTNDLLRRVYEHKEKRVAGFTAKYNVNQLVYYEQGASNEQAIAREKQIKAGSRQKKVTLIQGMNPEWKDLTEDLII